MNFLKYPAKVSSAWKILLDCGINSLPVNTARLAKMLGAHVVPYSMGWDLLRGLRLYDNASQTDGMALYIGGQPVIFVDDSVTVPRMRVTIGHELGHIILGHVRPGEVTWRNRPPAPSDAPDEFSANLFCEQLVAPSAVMFAAGVDTLDSIADLCGITARSAAFVLARQAERGTNYRPAPGTESALLASFTGWLHIV